MNKLPLLSAGLAATIVMLLPAVPAQAQTRTVAYISSAGNDANPCSRASPCLNIAAAITATVAGGEVQCLDSGPFLPATITKSITIDCGGTSGTVLNGQGQGPTAFTINGAGIIVHIRNLTINGFNGGGSIGIDFQNGAALFVENCVIKNFNISPAIGIRFLPSAPGSQLIVTDTLIDNNGIGANGGGIQVAPAGGSAGIVLNRVRFGFNVTAMALQSSNGTIGAVMRDSVVSASRSNGILSLAGQSLNFKIERSSLVNNVGMAIQSSGANSLVRIGGSEVTNNQTGLSAAGGGQILSYQNNEINGNGTDGAPTGVLTGI